LPAVIKKGKCEYIPLHVPESLLDNENENEDKASFDHLANLVAQDSSEEVVQSVTEEEIDPGKTVEDAKLEAERIIEEARIRAGAIIDDANTDAIRIKAEAEEIIAEAKKFAEEESAKAYEKGFEQGKRDGEELGQRKFS
jgi:vacuolar-type H+-ATPase subunit H